ncbi:hypothetical protein niasHT_013347 [Heterodera trifolii]|uniref:Uncharacterized protein n=1 Tax=Heterodera trifolii TaxID=157864 RepID=A0ABD2L7T2_9BILA
MALGISNIDHLTTDGRAQRGGFCVSRNILSPIGKITPNRSDRSLIMKITTDDRRSIRLSCYGWYMLYSIVTLGLALFCGHVRTEDRAEVDIRVSGACSPIYLSRRGIELSKYRPLIRFNPEKIRLVPKNPVIPGCVKIKAEGVEILRPIRNLLAEVEMRIGGTPDPNNPTLPCTKKIDDKVNQCPCAKAEGTCLFCDFCRQMRSQQAKVSASEAAKVSRGSGAASAESLEEQCKCEVMQPGLYDIETEMCTPELDDAKQFIPTELQNNVMDKTPISMFITVYLMDLQTHANESYLSAFGRAILQRRMAQSTVACFLMGLDVTLATAQQQQQSQQQQMPVAMEK